MPPSALGPICFPSHHQASAPPFQAPTPNPKFHEKPLEQASPAPEPSPPRSGAVRCGPRELPTPTLEAEGTSPPFQSSGENTIFGGGGGTTKQRQKQPRRGPGQGHLVTIPQFHSHGVREPGPAKSSLSTKPSTQKYSSISCLECTWVLTCNDGCGGPLAILGIRVKQIMKL